MTVIKLFLYLDMEKILISGIVKLEKLRNEAFAANELLSADFEFYSDEKKAIKKAEKLQASFEKNYNALVIKFRALNADAKDYPQWESVSPLEFNEEINNY